MKQRLILSIFGSLMVAISWAQDAAIYTQQPITEYTTEVYTDAEISFYKEPGQTIFTGKIPAGMTLKVIDSMHGEEVHMNKYLAVAYKNKTVYVHKKDLAFKKVSTKDNDFYFRIGAFYLGGEYNNSLLYLTSLSRNDKNITDSYVFPLVTDQGFISLNVFNNKGLKDITNFIEVDYQGESCGAESGSSWIYWNASDGFNHLADLMGWADMDYIEERFIFPSDEGGKPNKIIYEIEHGVLEEDTVDAEYKVTKKQKNYTLKNGNLSPEFKSLISTINP